MSALSRTAASAEEEARLLEMLAGVEEDDSSDAGSSGSGDLRDQQEEVPSQPAIARPRLLTPQLRHGRPRILDEREHGTRVTRGRASRRTF